MLKLLLMSTPVGALGSGEGGGVELTLKTLAQEMLRRGHAVKVIAPMGSQLPGIPLIEIPGQLQSSMQTQPSDAAIMMPKDAVLANMWEYSRQNQAQYDIIVNFAYDWLPFYLTPFFSRPVAHWVTMASLSAVIEQAVRQTAERFPQQVGFYTRSQAATFGLTEGSICLGSAIDLSLYQFCREPAEYLTWMGRISPEKALEDAVAAAEVTRIPLKILGKLQDADYWQQIQQDYPNAPIEYKGFLSTAELQPILRQSRALLVTPRWLEAFGNVAIEALACGVPVIAYRQGGLTEIVREGKTGFLVEPDSVNGLIEAISRLDKINRADCRSSAEEDYSLVAMGDRAEAWFERILNSQ